MDLKLSRKSQLPVHAQLKAQLTYLIETGQLASGAQLPTVRQLAGFLRINRNTVSKVFSQLEREGFLSCEPGRGTFVSTTKAGETMHMEKMRRLVSVVDEAIEKAGRIGFSPEDFFMTLYARTHTASRKTARSKLRALFVECNRPQLKSYPAQLEDALPLRVHPMLLEELARGLREKSLDLRPYSLVITTFFHVHEVRDMLAETGMEVVGLLVEPSLDVLMRLAALPEGTEVGAACYEWKGTENLKLSIRNAGLEHIQLIPACGDDEESLRRMVDRVSIIVCSTLVAAQIRAMASPDKEVVVDDRRLDTSGIEMLREHIRSLSNTNRDRKGSSSAVVSRARRGLIPKG